MGLAVVRDGHDRARMTHSMYDDVAHGAYAGVWRERQIGECYGRRLGTPPRIETLP